MQREIRKKESVFRRKKNLKGPAAPAPLPDGVLETVCCVYDEKQKVKVRFRSAAGGSDADERMGCEPVSAVVAEAAAARRSASFSFAYGSGLNRYVALLPFESKRGKRYLASMQITVGRPKPDEAPAAYACALDEGRVLFLVADKADRILAVSPRIPQAFGYSAESLLAVRLQDLFAPSDLSVIQSCSPDSNQSIQSCEFFCLDGLRREVEVKKFTAADGCTLFSICDIARAQLNEESNAVAARERRRIGQDLHDSIGQMLTGISLLSRSLANSLERAGNEDFGDAQQISELADEASNQIRQISRGLMPSDVVQRGLLASLRELAAQTTDSCGLACDAVLDDGIPIRDGAVETHLFRIAQEAVNNAVRHSGGSRITIKVSAAGGGPKLEISDNGRWRNILENQGGIGLKTMEYRASAINARLNIGRADSGGTRVTCQLEAEEIAEAGAV